MPTTSTGILVAGSLFFQLQVVQESFDPVGAVWVVNANRIATVTMPPGFYIDAQSYINSLVTAWQSADLFMIGTQIFFNTTTNQLSFTHIVPLHTSATASTLVRYWFRPVNNASFVTAWTDQGLQNVFNNPAAFGPPPVGTDVSQFVTSANYDTIVTGQSIPFFTGASPIVITSSWQMVSQSTAPLVVPQTNINLILGITIPAVIVLIGIIVTAVVLSRWAADHAAEQEGKAITEK